jgi:hemoglobin
VVRALLVLVIVLGALGTAACGRKAATQTQPSGPVLYDRLGRMDVIKDIVRDFVEHGLREGALAKRFSSADVARLEEGLATQLCELAQGPCKYTGRPMREAHAGMTIDEADFEVFLGALRRSLARYRIARREQDELLGHLRELRDQIVTTAR